MVMNSSKLRSLLPVAVVGGYMLLVTNLWAVTQALVDAVRHYKPLVFEEPAKIWELLCRFFWCMSKNPAFVDVFVINPKHVLTAGMRSHHSCITRVLLVRRISRDAKTM